MRVCRLSFLIALGIEKESHNCYGLDGMESGVTVELHYP